MEVVMAVKDKVVVITGSAQGVGRQIVRTFAAEGARLALLDIAPFDNVLADIKHHDVDVLSIHTDVREPDRVRAAMEQIHNRFGRMDVLINDAGIVTHFQWGGARWPRIVDMEPDFFDKVMRTNLYGTFLSAKYALPYMEAQREGHVINFGQGNVGRGDREFSPGATVYHVSKVSIRAFTQDLAAEERDYNICIMAMGPGGEELNDPRRGIATHEAPEEAKQHMRPVEDVVGNRFIIAAEAPMEFSGHMVQIRNGKVVLAPDERT
jgi:NAD(P)-dependent dehydrogenase (short-subunit alcohol dehydrogenase family)